MVGERIAPLDKVTMLPLSIAPAPPELARTLTSRRNFHHPFHPEQDPRLQTIAGLAVRHSRVQKVNVDLHNRYHNLFKGPPLPKTEEAAFNAAVFAVAGVVSRYAVDVSLPNEYSKIELDDKTYNALTKAEIIHPSNKHKIGHFFATYAAKQLAENGVDDAERREFLDRKTSKECRLELARTIFLPDAIDLSVEGLQQRHDEFRADGLVATHAKHSTIYSVVKKLIRTYSLPVFADNLYQGLSETT